MKTTLLPSASERTLHHRSLPTDNHSHDHPVINGGNIICPHIWILHPSLGNQKSGSSMQIGPAITGTFPEAGAVIPVEQLNNGQQ
jgi:hypothetical protein